MQDLLGKSDVLDTSIFANLASNCKYPVAISISADVEKRREMVSKLVDLWELGILGDMQVF
jgi:hypothetical protein